MATSRTPQGLPALRVRARRRWRRTRHQPSARRQPWWWRSRRRGVRRVRPCSCCPALGPRLDFGGWGESRLPSLRTSGALQIRRVAVQELRALERELGEEPVGAAVNELDGVVALERIERAGIAVDGDVAQRRGLALHEGTPAEMRLDIGGVRRHHRNEGLTQPRGRLRPEVAQLPRPHRLYGSRTIATRRYDVNDATTMPPGRFCPNRITSSITNSSYGYQDRVSSYLLFYTLGVSSTRDLVWEVARKNAIAEILIKEETYRTYAETILNESDDDAKRMLYDEFVRKSYVSRASCENMADLLYIATDRSLTTLIGDLAWCRLNKRRLNPQVRNSG